MKTINNITNMKKENTNFIEGTFLDTNKQLTNSNVIINILNNPKSNDYTEQSTKDTILIKTKEKILLYLENIQGMNRSANWFWMIMLFSFGTGFFLIGLSSGFSDSYQINDQNIMFIPQGIAMMFYGTIAILLSVVIFLSILWNIGSGKNSYDLESKIIRLTRNNLPEFKIFFQLNYPKNFVVYNFSQIEYLELKTITGLNPENICYIVLKDKRKIPLHLSNPITNLKFSESRAIFLSQIFEVDLKISK